MPPAPKPASRSGSTAAWLRHRLRLSARAATRAVRTARALFRGPLTQTAHALDGELSVAHAQVLAAGTQHLPDHLTAEPNRCWSRRPDSWTQVGCGGSAGTCSRSPTPTAPTAIGSGVMPAAGLWLAPTFDGMVAVDGLLEPEAGQSLLAALNRWPAQPTPKTPAVAANATPMPWPSWPAATWRGAGCPRPVGSGRS